MQHAPTKATRLAESQEYSFWFYRNIRINHWRSDVTPAAARKLASLLPDIVRESPEGVTSIHWLDPGASLPNAEARKILSELMVRYPGHVKVVGAVLETQGFAASAFRSAVTGIMLVAPTPIPVRVFGKGADLAAWLPHMHLRATGVIVTTEEVASVLRDAIGRANE
jgi:hypothetical protein